MTTEVAPFVIHRIQNHFIFLFPDIPYWFMVDSKEKRDTLKQLFHDIRDTGMDQAIDAFKMQKRMSRELEDFIETLKNAGIFTPPHGQAARPVPQLPRMAQLSIEVTKACNLLCQHCSVAAGSPRENEITLKEIDAFLAEVIQLMKGRREIVVTGGEPFLREDIFEILEICHRLMFKRILLLTNGTLITKRVGEVLGELNDRIERQNTPDKLIQRLHIQVSIDGTEETHDSIRGQNSWKRAVRGIGFLKDNNISTTVGMVLNNHNIRDVGAVIKLAGEMECSVGFSSMVKTGRAKDKEIEPVPASRVIPVVMKFIEKDPLYLKYLANFPLSPYVIAFQNLIKFRYCGTGWATVYMDSSGDVYPCQIGATIPEFKLGSIRETPFRQIWQHSPLLRELRSLHVDTLNDQCSHCEIRYFCGGGCRTEAYLSTGRLNGMDPKCIMGEKKKCAWGALRLIVKHPRVLEEVSELAIVRLMEDLFEEMSA